MTQYKTVPVEPTPEMRKAAADAWIGCDSKMLLNKAAAALRAGIAAAPQPAGEVVACSHEWFRTGGMPPGACRCIRCGKWGDTAQKPAEVSTSNAEALLTQALEAFEPLSAFGRVGSRDIEQAKAQEIIAAIKKHKGLA